MLSSRKKERSVTYGFSFHDDYEVFDEIIRYRDWDFCQIQYNYMDTEEQAGDKGYALAESLGIPLVIMEPIKGGSLAISPMISMPNSVKWIRTRALHPMLCAVCGKPFQCEGDSERYVHHAAG